MPTISMKFYHRCVFLTSVGVILCVVGICLILTVFSSSSSSSSSSTSLDKDVGSDSGGGVRTAPQGRRRNAAFLSHANNQQSSIPNVFPRRSNDDDVGSSCPASTARFADVDFNTLHLYEFLNMTGRGGGDEDWMDLNFNVFDVSRWRRDPLRVFVVPFSHSDPGWHKTAEEHYLDDSFHTINNAVLKLHQHKTMTFIWAESIYLSWWWRDSNSTMRLLLKELLSEGRFEVVGGGWVMPDEANPTAYSIVDQLLEGHLFLKQSVGFKPTSGFAIDPFGHSSVVARVASEAGLKHLVLQRIHYDLKKFFDHTSNAELTWRQLWDVEGKSDVFVYMNPYRLYAYKFTCGPDYRVCLEYDFQDIPGAYRDVKGTPINRLNVEAQSLKLLDQLRKKSLLFKHNVLLVLLGDDFRYTTGTEFDQQFYNWNQIFEFLNANSPQLYVEAKFGTLKDYFAEMEKAMEKRNREAEVGGGGRGEDGGARRLSLGKIKSVGGDFFTYDDENVSYWSGYYTSRMAWKILGRRLESSLRAADVFFALTADGRDSASVLKRLDFIALQQARQDLALFQHHDDITGTSTDHNMHDLAYRLSESIKKTQSVLAHAAWISLTEGVAATSYSPGSRGGEAKDALVSTIIPDSMVVGMKRVLIDVIGNSDSSSLLVLTNPLPFEREEIIHLYVNAYSLKVVEPSSSIDPRRRDDDGKTLPHQIDPVWSNHHNHVSSGTYSLYFKLEIGPFEIKRLLIEAVVGGPSNAIPQRMAKIGVINYGSNSRSNGNIRTDEFRVEEETKEEFVLSNGCLAAVFDGFASGHLRKVMKANSADGHASFDSRVEFLSYDSDRSGAYLFNPMGKAREVGRPLKTIVVSGPVQTTVLVVYPFAEQIVTVVGGEKMKVPEGNLGDSPATDRIENILSVSKLTTSKCKFSSLLDSVGVTNRVSLQNAVPNNELIMRVDTDIDSGDLFYTDSNAFEMVKRKRFAKLPIQGNYYPMPLATYIEDASDSVTKPRRRMTLLAGQPQGVSSLASGSVEVMQDRTLINDDYRGLGQGVLDNKLSILRYILLFEEIESSPISFPPLPPPLPYLSLTAHHLALRLNQPVDTFVRSPDRRAELPAEFLPTEVRYLKKSFPCDVELMSLRAMPIMEENTSDADKLLPSRNATSLMILHRPGFDCRFVPTGSVDTLCSSLGESLRLAEHFSSRISAQNAQHVSLTMMDAYEFLGNEATLDMKFRDLKSLLVDIRRVN